MALGAGMGLVNTALNNIQRTAEIAPMPLDAIEARRSKMQSEKLAQFEAETKRKTAEAQGVASQAASAKVANAAAGVSSETEEIRKINALYAPTVQSDDPDYLRQKYRYYDAMTKSDNPDVADRGRELMTQIEKEGEMSMAGGTTMQQQQQAAELARTQAETTERSANAQVAQAGMTQNVRAASPEDQTWALSVLANIDPGGNDLIPWNEWSDTEKSQYAQELAATLDQIRVNSAGSGLTESQMRSQAINAFKASQGMPGGVAQPPPQGLGGGGQAQQPTGAAPEQPMQAPPAQTQGPLPTGASGIDPSTGYPVFSFGN